MRAMSFGIYAKSHEYPRHTNLMKGLSSAGIQVHECHFDMTDGFQERMKSLTDPFGAMIFILKLLTSYLILAIKFFKAPPADFILIGYPGLFHLHLVKLLRLIRHRNALIVYDIFFSLYDTIVQDRKLLQENTLAARTLFHFERTVLKSSDRLLIDTHTHGRYLADLFMIPTGKFHRVFVGPTMPAENINEPAPLSKEIFKIIFIGTYIPLQGIDTLLKAACELQHEKMIRFSLIGRGQLRQHAEQTAENWGLPNVDFTDWIPADRIIQYNREAGLSLGIFGTSAKAQRVIPIKIFDICASGSPFITADTPAIREIFTHGENAWLVPPGDWKMLAKGILQIRSDPAFRNKLAVGALQVAHHQFTYERIGNQLRKAVS